MENFSLKSQLLNILSKYVPAGTAELLVAWIIEHKVILKITPRRRSILGNYYHPNKHRGHVITVNGDMNPYAFFVTLVHELAHMECWIKNRNKVQPHGGEWKVEFRNLMHHFLRNGMLPDDIEQALQSYLQNPAAASCSDDGLVRTLKRYDKQPVLTIEELPHESIFKFGDKTFKKGQRLRKRYKCVEVGTRRIYLFSPVAEVTTGLSD